MVRLEWGTSFVGCGSAAGWIVVALGMVAGVTKQVRFVGSGLVDGWWLDWVGKIRSSVVGW